MSWNWRDGGGVDVTRPGSQLIILAPFSTKVEKKNGMLMELKIW